MPGSSAEACRSIGSSVHRVIAAGRQLEGGAHRDGVGGVAPHHREGRVGAPQVDLALALPAAVRVAPLPLAQVVPAGAAGDGVVVRTRRQQTLSML
jgi:hypothetical protein